jgi:hypothetical protein
LIVFPTIEYPGVVHSFIKGKLLIGTTPVTNAITLTLNCDAKDANDKAISLTTQSVPNTGVYEFDFDPFV